MTNRNKFASLRSLIQRFDEDEDGASVVEAILLIVVAIIVITLLYRVIQWAWGNLNEAKAEMESEDPSSLTID